MKKFFRDCKGAVTVMVTLLLIPAILVSGTAVDITRLYAARSLLRDANQLAANSLLASYDALLQDLYGLFGIPSGDEELAGMADEYIRTAIEGDNPATGIGTFQLFYGSNLTPQDMVPAADQHLGNSEVLRRQIEEYAKFRAPVILVNGLLERLKEFSQMDGNADVIEQKMEIEDKIEEIDEVYEKIYKCILEINKAEEEEDRIFSEVNIYLADLRSQIAALKQTRDDYANAPEESRAGHEAKYNAILENIRNLVNGGYVGSGWEMGETAGTGGWNMQTYVKGMQPTADDGADDLEPYINSNDWKDNDLEALVRLCRDAEGKRRELAQLLDELEAKLNRKDYCSDELRDGLTQPAEGASKSTIEEYRELLAYDSVEAMGQAVQDWDGPQLEEAIDLLEDRLSYNGYVNGSWVTHKIEELGELQESDVPIDFTTNPEAYAGQTDLLEQLAGIHSPFLNSPTKTFLAFQDKEFSSTQNPEFYAKLDELYRNGGNDDAKDSVKSSITSVLDVVQDAFTGGLSFDPEGAWSYSGPPLLGDGGHSGTNFGSEGDWGEEDAATNAMKNALNGDLLTSLGNVAGQAVDKLLLLTYASEMFSDFTSPGAEEAEEDQTPPAENMAGIPLSIDVNYYFQSELEYLYAGDLDSAIANLTTAAGMIFLVRAVFNYVASFGVGEVNNAVNAIRTALSATGPFAIVLAELARIAFSLAESVIDLNRLRQGVSVAVFKDDDSWKFKASSLVVGAAGELAGIGTGQLSGLNDLEDDTGPATMTYKDYLRVFLLLVDGNTLASRTANLISLNVTNKREGIGQLGSREAREAAMASAEIFNMSEAVTGFTLTTTADLRMLFLSMPVAQRGLNGVVPPGTVPLSVTSYRGY